MNTTSTVKPIMKKDKKDTAWPKNHWPFNQQIIDDFMNATNELGLFSIFDDPLLNKNSSYPPHDIVKISESVYEIRFAVAGFDRENLEVTVKDDMLVVEGKLEKSDEPVETYVRKNISTRGFKNKFRMADHSEVSECNLTNGILNIRIEKHVPEDKLPKKVEIT